MAQNTISKITPSPQTTKKALPQGKDAPTNPRGEAGLNQQQIYQYDLQSERATIRGDREIADLKSNIHPPSKGRYLLGFVLAIMGDIIDVVAAILILVFGLGIPLGWLIDLLLDIPLVILGFASNKQLKKNSQASNALVSKIETIRQRVQQYRNLYAATLKASRKIKALRKPLRQVAKKFKAIRKVATKSVLGRTALRLGADFIPILDLWPWRFFGMRSNYKAEKQAYEDFLLLTQDYTESREEEVEATNDLLVLQQEEDIYPEASQQSQIAA